MAVRVPSASVRASTSGAPGSRWGILPDRTWSTAARLVSYEGNPHAGVGEGQAEGQPHVAAPPQNRDVACPDRPHPWQTTGRSWEKQQ